MGVPIRVALLTKNECYKQNKKNSKKGIIVHSTATPQPDPQVFINTWNKPGVEKAVHAFVGQKEIVQTLPWDMRCWGCAGKGNDTHIQFEICEPSGVSTSSKSYNAATNTAYFNAVYANAVDLCVMLCKQYGLTEKDILTHCEAYKKGIASNHADVMHWFPKHGKSMDTLRADVKAKLNSSTAQVAQSPKESAATVPAAVAPTSNKLLKVIVQDLYTYNSANWNDKGILVHKNEVYTVVQELKVNGSKMYKLKSGKYITANTKYVKIQ